VAAVAAVGEKASSELLTSDKVFLDFSGFLRSASGAPGSAGGAWRDDSGSGGLPGCGQENSNAGYPGWKI
jgi:hypothetical protein